MESTKFLHETVLQKKIVWLADWVKLVLMSLLWTASHLHCQKTLLFACSRIKIPQSLWEQDCRVCGRMRNSWAWCYVLVELRKKLVNIFSMLQNFEIFFGLQFNQHYVKKLSCLQSPELKFHKHETMWFSCLSSQKLDAEIQEPDFHASWIKRLMNVQDVSE